MDEPVLLDVDPSQVVLEPTAAFAASEDVRRAFPALAEGKPGLERLQNPRLWRARFSAAGERVRAILSRLRADTGLSFVSEVFTSRVGGHPFIPTNFITVRFKDGTSSRQIDSLAQAVGLRLLRRPDPDMGMDSYGFAYPRGAVPLKVAAALARQPLVEWADPGEYNPGQDASAPNDPFYSLQYYLRNAYVHNGVPVDIAVEGAWTLTTGGGVPVAVLDRGVEIGHPDLCTPPYLGFDAWPNDTTGYSVFFPNLGDDHGTNVAGIITACRDNSVGMAGVAPSAVLMIARIKRLGVMIGPDTVAMAINWAWLSGAWVINLSWNMANPHAVVTEAINNAETRGRNGKGTVVVGAAGNTSDRRNGIIGNVWYPATLPSVIAVGAIDRYGDTTNYAPEGSALDVVAPSSYYTTENGLCPGDVLTLNLVNGRGNCNDGPGGDPDYRSTFGGTSAAAPQVSAVAALVLSREPWLTAAQVRTRLASTADYWGSPSVFGAGKLNASRAVGYVPPPPPPPAFAASISGPNPVQPVSSCLFTASTVSGTEPFTFAWTANGYSVGDNSSTYRHYNYGWDAFELGITVTDAQGRIALNLLSVSVSYSAPECLDQ